ncbi:LysR family transcriptional regulator [bacterium]|nr:LysR family transcriptional regulator [bacterium]
MDPRRPHLETFAEAAEQDSFTAASRLSVTQATVGQRVQQLEARLNIPLFSREAGGVTLTETGRRLGPRPASPPPALATVAAGHLVAFRAEWLPLTLYLVRVRRAVLPPPARLFLAHVGTEPAHLSADAPGGR